MCVLRFLFWTVLSCSLLSRSEMYASVDSRHRGSPPVHEKSRIGSKRFVENPALSAGRLNEFILDGTESCVEIKKGSSAIRPTLVAVTNAASYSDRIAPGGLAVLWGTRFSEVGEEYVASSPPLSRLLGRVH